MTLPTVDAISLADLQKKLDAKSILLVDVLPPEHYAARRIPGAVNACVYEMTFQKTMAELAPAKDAAVVLYGAGPDSQDSIAAADKLGREGYTALSVFHGGLTEWRDNDLPLEGDAADVVEPPHPVLDLGEKTYKLVYGESMIKWTGRNNNGGHVGTLSLSAGEMHCQDDINAEFTIDMTSIKDVDLEGTELQPVLETHLKSDDFFFTKLFPKAEFKTTQVKLVENAEATRPNAMVQGELSLRGMTNEIAFPAHIRNIDDGKIALLANLDFDRTQWGVIYGSSRFFQHLSYHVVYDFISVDLRIVLK